MKQIIRGLIVGGFVGVAAPISIALAKADANQKDNRCEVKLNNFIQDSINIIEKSELAEANSLSCNELKTAAGFNANTLAITSGRKRGKFTICISDDRKDPCKIRLGTFKDTQNPSLMLSNLFDVKVEHKGYLNETVERLFLTPSSLIK